MADIKRLDVWLLTGSKNGAGTDGDVYIGLAGREFFIDSAYNDFEACSNRTYTLGAGANVHYASFNSPCIPQLDTGDLDKYPVYLRFEPRGEHPDWNLERITVTVNPGPKEMKFDNVRLAGGPDIWLGQRFGKSVYLSRA